MSAILLMFPILKETLLRAFTKLVDLLVMRKKQLIAPILRQMSRVMIMLAALWVVLMEAFLIRMQLAMLLAM